MTNTAIVNRVKGSKIYLMHIKDYGDKEATERSFWDIKELDFMAENPKEFKLFPGDAVEYYIPEGKTILASFTVLILPLVVFLATFGILSALGIGSDKIKALLSIGVMGLSFFIPKLLKKIGIKETLPVIIAQIEKEQLAELATECKDCGSCTICK